MTTIERIVKCVERLPDEAQQRVLGYAEGLAVAYDVEEDERRWEELFADPRSEEVLTRLAEEARSTPDEELRDLEDSGL
jgi:hypothetical protein